MKFQSNLNRLRWRATQVSIKVTRKYLAWRMTPQISLRHMSNTRKVCYLLGVITLAAAALYLHWAYNEGLNVEINTPLHAAGLLIIVLAIMGAHRPMVISESDHTRLRNILIEQGITVGKDCQINQLDRWLTFWLFDLYQTSRRKRQALAGYIQAQTQTPRSNRPPM